MTDINNKHTHPDDDDLLLLAAELLHGEPTDADIDALRTSEALRRAVLDGQDMGITAQRDAHPIDVEARLQAFHESHREQSEPAPRASRAKIVAFVLAAAAAVLALVVVSPTTPEAPSAGDPFFAQTATDNSKEVNLTTSRGEAVAVGQGEQDQSITVADFRKLFAEAEAQQDDVTLHVPQGRSADITLPDGSVVYLHPGARLMFPTRFPSDKRVVKLDGEAYFKVTHQDNQPFIVMTESMETTVLGTEFNVNTHSREVSLVNGSIRVKSYKADAERLLKPGQQLKEDGNGTIAVNRVDTTPYEYWRDGYLYFDDAPLDEILTALAANYDKRVTYRDSAAQHLRMRFFTERSKGVEKAVEMLNSMRKVHVSVQGERIVVE